MITEKNFRKIVFASALYDFVVTAPLATPWTFKIVLSLAANIQKSLGLTGVVPAYNVEINFFANLMGSIVLVWAVLRLRTPEPRFGRYDACGRAAFSLWMIYAAEQGVSSLLYIYAVLEIFWLMAQSLPYRKGAA